MNITCSKQVLLAGLNIVSKAVPSNTPYPMMKNILINATGNDIILTANDVTIGIETKIEGEVETAGIVAIDCAMFTEAIRLMPDGDLNIVVKDDFSVYIKYGNREQEFMIRGVSGDSFTYLPDIDKKEPIELSMMTIKDIVRQTGFSLKSNNGSAESTMSGYDFNIFGDYMRVTTLDGQRISIKNIEFDREYPKQEIIIPGKTLNDICKILPSDAEKKVNLYITDSHIMFEFDSTVVVSRLIEGKFISIEKILQTEPKSNIKVDKKIFSDTIRRAGFFSKENDKKPIIFETSGDILNIRIANDNGNMDEKLEVEKEGDDIRIGFNPKFILDAVGAVDDEEITAYFINSITPMFIKDEKENYIYVILPINIS